MSRPVRYDKHDPNPPQAIIDFCAQETEACGLTTPLDPKAVWEETRQRIVCDCASCRANHQPKGSS